MKKLRKSKDKKILAGVCGGIAEYFNIDVTIVRLVWTVSSLFAFSGVIIYIIAMILMPQDTLGDEWE